MRNGYLYVRAFSYSLVARTHYHYEFRDAMQTEMNQSSEEYEAPKLTPYGNITQITRSGEVGGLFDASFSRGQDVPDPDGDGNPNIFS